MLISNSLFASSSSKLYFMHVSFPVWGWPLACLSGVGMVSNGPRWQREKSSILSSPCSCRTPASSPTLFYNASEASILLCSHLKGERSLSSRLPPLTPSEAVTQLCLLLKDGWASGASRPLACSLNASEAGDDFTHVGGWRGSACPLTL